MKKLFLILIPALLIAQGSEVEAKPDPGPPKKVSDPITDKMRFDFALQQIGYLKVMLQACPTESKVQATSDSFRAACEGSGLSFDPSQNQFGCSPKQVAGVDAKTGKRMARADQKAAIPPADDAAEQRKKQLADAAKKKAEDEAKKAAQKE